MGRLTQEMLENDLLESHELMQVSGQHGPTLAQGTLGAVETGGAMAAILENMSGQPSH